MKRRGRRGKTSMRWYRRLPRPVLLLALSLTLLAVGAGSWKITHTPAPPNSQLALGATEYTVVAGDSLSAIAARFGVSDAAIMADNGITNPNLVVTGTQLRIPLASGLPNDRQGVQRLVASYARMYGLPPSFALAVAWQESGFNQNMVSSTGAIGVMQVEPDTAVTVGNLLGRPLNLHDIADNVQCGVYWLARLAQSYGGDQRLAAAAYYQGARSVSRDGLFPDTERYVNDVMALEGRFAD